MKLGRKISTLVSFAILICAVLTISVFAADGSGYMFDSDGKTYTNIKWTFTEATKTVVFEIDASATDKKASTVLYGFDPLTGALASWGSPIQNGWGQLTGLKKAIIKEGITEISGGLFALNRTVAEVELPKSLKKITGDGAFQGCHALTSIYIAGGTPSGEFDLSSIESFEGAKYVFDNCKSMKAMKLSENLKGDLGTEFIKNAPLLAELTIPSGVTSLNAKSLTSTQGLKVLIILGEETTFADDSVFNTNTVFPSIKAKATSKAAEFAKANGYTFIDLDSGEETKGTKPAPSDTPVVTPPPSSGTTTPSVGVGLDAFDQDECTAYGYIGGQYYDTYWVYYQETKTLKFFSNKTSGWNETGRIDKCEDKIGWNAYKNEIEYVEIGPQLAKVTSQAFRDHTALKEVKLGKNITQIDGDAFSGCTSLTTVWYDGGERVEGRCDLTKIPKVNTIITNTAIEEVLLSSSASLLGTLGFNVKRMLSPNINDVLIQYAKDNGYKLVNSKNPEEVYDYYVEMPADIVMCGERCGFGFDEATGTLTVYGSGAISDIINYYGGGSKTSPWFSIKKQIKHVVIGDAITAIGKYCFTQCENLETVQLPDCESFIIENAAFEKCTNLKSIYRKGTEPVEGTLDLRNVHEIKAWTFAYDYLIANVIVSPQVAEIGTSVFEENVNLANIYGTPGSYAETYASEGGKTFYDIASNTPQPIKCEIPVSETETEAVDVTTAPNETSVPESEGETTEPLFVFDDETESKNENENKNADDTDSIPSTGSEDEDGGFPIVVIIIAAVVIIAAIIVIIIIAKKKKK